MSLSVTSALGSGTNRTHVKQNFDDVVAWANGASLTNANLTGAAGITDANLASPNNSVYKTLFDANSGVNPDKVAGTYLFQNSGLVTSPYTLSTGAAFVGFYFDDADYTVGGKTTKLRVRGQVLTNGTIPAITFTFGLYPVAFSGAADTLTATLGAVVAGTTAAVASPSANGTANASSSDATIPSDGLYILGVVTSATLTNNAACALNAQLQVRNV